MWRLSDIELVTIFDVLSLELRSELAAEAVERSLACRGRSSLTLGSASMRPILPVGSEIEIRPVRTGEDLCGALVAFRRGHRVIVHRVISHRGDALVTRGIACRHADPPCQSSDVLGVVCAAVGYVRSERLLRGLAALAALAFRIKFSIQSFRKADS